jgi:hypothetical protein
MLEARLRDVEDDLPPERAAQLPFALRNGWFKRKATEYDPRKRGEDTGDGAAAPEPHPYF